MRKLLAAALLFAACAAPRRSPDLVVLAPRMLDVRTGNIVSSRAVIIYDGKIVGVEDSTLTLIVAKNTLSLPADAILIPGLIDVHTHIAWIGAKGGICESTFKEPGVDTPEEARARVRKLVDDGADLIKICTGGGVIGRPADAAATEMRPEVIQAIVEEAHRRGRKVAAHAQGPAAIKAAALAGVDSIEHGGLIDDDAARLLAERRIPLVPTLARLAQNPRLHADAIARVRRARELGVTIVLGTDGTVLPHSENAKELDELVAVGMTPVEAIRAATLDAARLLGRETSIGAIEPGFEADLVGVTSLVPADVKLVIARGRVVRNDWQ